MIKNKFTISAVLTTVLAIGLGCGITDRVQKAIGGEETPATKKTEDKSLSDTAIETAVGNEKIGVPECDDLMDFFEQQSKSNDDNYMTKATRQMVMNKIRESIKKSIEENKNDKAQMAKDCKEYKSQLEKFKAEEESNKQ